MSSPPQLCYHHCFSPFSELSLNCARSQRLLCHIWYTNLALVFFFHIGQPWLTVRNRLLSLKQWTTSKKFPLGSNNLFFVFFGGAANPFDLNTIESNYVSLQVTWHFSYLVHSSSLTSRTTLQATCSQVETSFKGEKPLIKQSWRPKFSPTSFHSRLFFNRKVTVFLFYFRFYLSFSSVSNHLQWTAIRYCTKQF